LCIYPDNKDDVEMQLLEIRIPLVTNRADWKRLSPDRIKESTNEQLHTLKNEFQFLYRVSFYHMNQDSSFTRLSIPPKELVISNGQRFYTINLEDAEI
jgi:hypothetical protein